MQNEIWKAIPGYEAYEVSNEGKVRSLKWGKIKELKAFIGRGYLKVKLRKNGKLKNFYLHQIVAMAFLNHKPDGHNLVIDHINNNKLDNCLENLRVTTQRFNTSRYERNLPTGVSWNKGAKKYLATIQINGKLKYLGYFLTPEEASEAYQTALRKINL